MTVQTTRGPVAAESLGKTLIHEHIFSLYLDYRADYGFDEELERARAAASLADVHAAGITTVVDMTVYGLGRNVGRVKAIVDRVPGLNVAVATGIYTFRDLPGFFRNRARFLGEDSIGDLFIRELAHGVGDSGVRAAAVKLVTDEQGVSPDMRLIARQVARAHHATGAPIITHSHSPTRQGLAQQELLRDLGVDLGRVVIGHAGDSDDLGYLEELIANGSYLGMDRFGFGFAASLEQRIDVVTALCQRGYADRLVLSHDANVHSDAVPDEIREDEQLREWNFRCIPDLVLPALRERGVSEVDLHAMLTTNPARVLDVT